MLSIGQTVSIDWDRVRYHPAIGQSGIIREIDPDHGSCTILVTFQNGESYWALEDLVIPYKR
jgi:hypothetical protein